MLRVVSSLYLFLLAANSLWAADTQTEDEQQAKERWFQIELIIFARTDKAGLSAENWPDDAVVPDVKNAIDFLTPPSAIKQTEKENTDTTLTDTAKTVLATSEVTNNVATDNFSLSPVSTEQTTTPPHPFELKASELPFIALTSPDFILSPHAKVIKRSRKYQLIRHITWHQPVLSKAESVPVRIFGGEDFADRFDDDGYPLLNLPQNELLSEATGSEADFQNEQDNSRITDGTRSISENSLSSSGENSSLHKITDSSDLTLLTAEEVGVIEQQQESEQKLSESEPLPETGLPEFEKPQRHNWQLDGLFTVYVKRYLHVRFDLAYKNISMKEVDESQFASFTNFAFPEQINNTTVADEATTPQQNSTDENSFELPAHLNWNDVEDENLLSFGEPGNSQKLQLEYLKPFLMQQKRRVRSKEIHYFDHPLFGVIMLITPYDPEPVEEDSENETETDIAN